MADYEIDSFICSKLRELEEPLDIKLPVGVTLHGITKLSDGPPTNCDICMSLLMQITPFLAAIACPMQVLKALNSLISITEQTNPIEALPGALKEAAEILKKCLGMITGPVAIAIMVVGILRVIIKFLGCIIELIESILDAQLDINLNVAKAKQLPYADQLNPKLDLSLQCAQNNLQVSMDGAMNSFNALEPILFLINLLLEIVGEEPIELESFSSQSPSLSEIASDISGENIGAIKEEILGPIKSIRDLLDENLLRIEKIASLEVELNTEEQNA